MKKVKKIVALLLCAFLLTGASVAGTLAYLTSTDVATNTFTVGKVNIELHEKDYDNDGNNQANKYEDIIPGLSYEKEPVVTVKADSEDCYVRAKVTVTIPNWNKDNKETGTFSDFVSNFDAKYIRNDFTNIAGFNTINWTSNTPAVDETNKTIVYYLYYINTDGTNVVKSSDSDNHLSAIFNDIYIPSELDSTTLPYLEGMTIKVEAHAIQAEGFEASEEATAEQNAWAAFDSQNT